MRRFIVGAIATGMLSAPCIALSPKTEAVAAFVGVMSFVTTKCPDLAVDVQALNAASVERGIDVEDLMQDPEFKALGVSAYRGMLREQDRACAMAMQNFGPNGSTIPGLINKR